MGQKVKNKEKKRCRAKFMYDVVMGRRINKKKVILLIIIIVIAEFIAVIAGINFAQKKFAKEEAEALLEKVAQIEKEEEEKRLREEQRRQAIIESNIYKVSNPLTEEQQYNILHMYKSEQ